MSCCAPALAAYTAAASVERSSRTRRNSVYSSMVAVFLVSRERRGLSARL
jgi:hypothetical protein